MSLYVIADLHLSFSSDKPMDVFGGWQDHIEKLTERWTERVLPEDTVVIPGDISWAMSMAEATEDFRYIHNLPGKKIILKGNHDYWFQTKRKADVFLEENGFDSIQILFNNAYTYGEYVLCGTRGWMNEKGETPDKKILLREAGRLRLSLEEGEKTGKQPIVFLHYPPVYENDECTEIVEILREYGIKLCCYGHLHGASCKRAVTGMRDGIEYRLVSCDYIQFTPMKLL